MDFDFNMLKEVALTIDTVATQIFCFTAVTCRLKAHADVGLIQLIVYCSAAV